MKTGFKALAFALGTAALLGAAPGAAGVKVATYSGIIKSGFDHTGVFGTPNTDLTGLSYVARYTYDRALGHILTDDSTYDESYGDSVVDSSPVIKSSITINGFTRFGGGINTGYLWTGLRPIPDSSLVSSEGLFYSDNGVIDSIRFFYNSANTTGAPSSLNKNFAPMSSIGSGGFQFISTDYSGSDYVYTEWANAEWDNSAVVYSVSDPTVPEPASWAMMIAGFGLVGAMLRRRGTVVAA